MKERTRALDDRSAVSEEDARADFVARLIQSQMDLMSRQLALLAAANAAPAPCLQPASATTLTVPAEVLSPAITTSVLAPGQLEHWLSVGISNETRLATNESLCLILHGNVDHKALRQAAEEIIARHAAFRLVFDRKEPLQRLQDSIPSMVSEIDLGGHAQIDAAFEEFCREKGKQLFEIDKAPLAAAYIVRLGDNRTAFFLVVCHLIFDGWASTVFVDELATAYQACRTKTPLRLKAPACPLVFASEEAERFAGAEGSESLAYWTRLLADPPRLPHLHDKTALLPRALAAGTVRSTIDEVALERIRRRARASGVTLFQFMLAAVAAMLQERTGQDDFVIGIPYASQALQPRGPLIADGVLDLPVRLHCNAADGADAVLRHVRDRLLDAVEHPLATQNAVARALGIRGEGGRPPLTGIYFNLNPKIELKGFEPLQASLREGPKHGILNDLFFSFYEVSDGLSLDLHYSADLFSATRVRELVGALWKVCRRWADPQAPAASVVALPERYSQGKVRALAADLTIQNVIGEQVRRTPDRIAVSASGTFLTYRDLEYRSNAIANVLKARGVKQGSLVGVCLERGIHLLPALIGVLKAGAGYVPLDPGFPSQRLRYMADDAGITLLITESSHADLCGVPQARQLRLDEDSAEVDRAPREHDGVAPAEGATAYVIYTSGSTGRPKGVVVPHRAVCNFLRSMRAEPGISEDDVILAVTTLSFDIAVLEMFLPLICGARVVIADRSDVLDGRVLAAKIADQGVTLMQATPTTWQMLVESGWQPPAHFRALCGGEALPPALATALVSAGVELWNMYGPTETTVWSTAARISDPSRRMHIGTPIDNTRVWIVDGNLQPCAPGAEGEIIIGGAGVATGYHNLPALTAERFIPSERIDASISGRAYRTGDLGRRAADGTLEHLGRMDSQVKIRGHRVELAEVERVVAEQARVAEVVVIPADASGAAGLRAYLRASRGSSPDAPSIRKRVAESLPDYMVPARWIVLDAFPRTPNGKVDRKALAEIADTQGAHDDPTGYLAPQTDAEIALAPIWSAVLDVQRPGVLDDFFDAGGNSLLAFRLMSRIRSELEHDLPLEALFDHPNIRGLATAITSKLELSAGIMVPLREAGSKPVLALIAGVGGHVFAYHQFAKALSVDVPVYGMKAVGIDGAEPSLDSIPAIGARYVHELLARHPDGPYVIAGYSVGARIALEVALQLERLGKSVARIVVFDMYAPGYPPRMSISKRIAYHWRGLRSQSWRTMLSYLREKAPLALLNEAEQDRHELEKLGVVPAEILESISKGLLKASMDYAPAGKSLARVTSVVCSHRESWQENLEIAHDNGWSQFTSAGVDVLEVEAAHLDLFKGKVFQQMVRMMSDILDNTRMQARAVESSVDVAATRRGAG